MLFQFSACNCNEQGSSSSSCSDSGVCTCNANIGGDKCEACNDGLFNFPTCSRKKYYLSISLVGFFFIGSNDETCLVVQEKSKNSGR